MGSGQHRTKAQAQLYTRLRQVENASPAIIRMDLAIKQTTLLQRVHQVASGHRIDGQPLREPALVEAGLVVKSSEHGELEGREVVGLRHLCQHT
jgi:hypothetical protein